MIRSKKQISIGGFCGINSGKIIDSHSIFQISKIKNLGNFCFRNNGEIYKSYSKLSNNNKKINKFYQDNNGTIIDCNNNNIAVDNSKEENFSDGYTSLAELNLSENNSTEPIIIKTKEQLFDISEKIKNGDTMVASSYYILENDIDLKGKSWEPLGNANCPFTGIFDGCGHKIYNFKVTNKELIFAGFFGLIENAIIKNLDVDGIIKVGKYSGGFAGMNKNGKIYSCAAICQVIGKDLVGGFVANNSGIIENCRYAGVIKKPFPLVWIALFLLGVLGTLIYLYVLNPMKNTSIFNNVPVDPYSVKTQDHNIYDGDGNKASFKFSDVVKFSNGKGIIDFGNPDTTNQSMTIKIQVTDQELINKIGKTGRTEKEQNQLNSNDNYDPSNARITLSESGLILPGYSLSTVTLNDLPDGTNLPNGIYNGIAYLEFFEYETNEKAIINSQIPIAIVVE